MSSACALESKGPATPWQWSRLAAVICAGTHVSEETHCAIGVRITKILQHGPLWTRITADFKRRPAGRTMHDPSIPVIQQEGRMDGNGMGPQSGRGETRQRTSEALLGRCVLTTLQPELYLP